MLFLGLSNQNIAFDRLAALGSLASHTLFEAEPEYAEKGVACETRRLGGCAMVGPLRRVCSGTRDGRTH